MIIENINVPKCANCDDDHVYACIGIENTYVCRPCYEKVLNGELTLEEIRDK
jgi:hypothetical protein